MRDGALTSNAGTSTYTHRLSRGKELVVSSTPGNNEVRVRRVAIQVSATRLLVRAHALISSSSGWTKGELARDRHSHPVSPTNPRAVRFCASGALLRAAGEQLGLTIRLCRPGEAAAFVEPEPLAEAYQVVGAVLVESFLPTWGIEPAGDDEYGPTLYLPLRGGGLEVEHRLAWRTVLEEVNDANSVRHKAIAALLRLAAIESGKRIVDLSRPRKNGENSKHHPTPRLPINTAGRRFVAQQRVNRVPSLS